jgi:hypothetical protein
MELPEVPYQTLALVATPNAPRQALALALTLVLMD